MVDQKHVFIIAVIMLAFAAFQIRKRKNILMTLFGANGTFCMHYLLNPSLPGFAINALNGARNLMFAHRESNKAFGHKAISFAFSFLVLILGIVAWNGPITIIFVIGNIISCFGMRSGSTTRIRRTALISSAVLCIYELFGGTIVGVLYECTIIISSAIGLMRFKHGSNRRKK